MTGPHPAVAACRRRVRQALAAGPAPRGGTVIAACSGGADSLALTAAVAFEAPKLGLRTVAVVVDHRLQPGSGDVAERAAEQCRDLGVDRAEIRRVEVSVTGDGPESAARDARYAALADAAAAYGADQVLLGHTRDDQAETVLLALARGSGPRALTGMAPSTVTPAAGSAPATRWARPLLEVTRAETAACCAALGLHPWQDPHNQDPRYLRVRVRRALAELEADIGPGVVAGLARTATLVRDDLTFLDDAASTIASRLGDPPWPVGELVALATPLRTRVWRELLRRAGAPGSALGKVHIDAADALLTDWHGQRATHLPGGLQIRRGAGLILLEQRRVE